MFEGMLVFQLAGALILLLNSINGSNEAVIKNCFSGSNMADRDDNNICTIPKEKLRNSAHKIYLNIVAFLAPWIVIDTSARSWMSLLYPGGKFPPGVKFLPLLPRLTARYFLKWIHERKEQFTMKCVKCGQDINEGIRLEKFIDLCYNHSM